MLTTIKLILLWTLSFILCACSTTQQSKFYLLESLENESVRSNSLALKKTIVELRVADFPGYLDRPQIVTRGPNYDVEINEYQRWAEPLQENFTRVLAANINSKITPTELVYQRVISSTRIDYRLFVKILRFDSDTQTGDVFLNVKWSLQKVSNKSIVSTREEQITIPVNDSDFTARVKGHSQAIASLANLIAAGIVQQQS